MATANCTDLTKTTYDTVRIDDATLRLSSALKVVQAIGIYQDNDGEINRPSDEIISGALYAARMLMEDAYNVLCEPNKAN